MISGPELRQQGFENAKAAITLSENACFASLLLSLFSLCYTKAAWRKKTGTLSLASLPVFCLSSEVFVRAIPPTVVRAARDG